MRSPASCPLLSACNPSQMYVPAKATAKHLKDRSRDEFVVEKWWYVTAANRREYIFPLKTLPDYALAAWTGFQRDFGWDVEIAQNDHEEVVDRALADFKRPDFAGTKPGKGRSRLSDFYPHISLVEPLAEYAFGEAHPCMCVSLSQCTE